MTELMKTDVRMTSLDVAEIVGKEHKNVMRDIRNEIESLGEEIGQLIFEPTERIDSHNRKQPIYTFGKDGAMQLALKYDAVTRYKVIKRIEELENQSLPQPMSQAELALLQAQNMVNLERRVEAQEEKLDNITNILSLSTNDWRNDVNKIINAIAGKLGGGQYYKEIRKESYDLLERRAACSLDRRIQNRKSKMALRGQSKSAISKLNALDVIAEDKKLVSVYITVIKELAVKYQLNLSDYHLTAEVEA